MFSDCEALEKIDVSKFRTNNVVDMSSLFKNCKAIKELDLSSFETNKVKDMSFMFFSNRLLTSLDLNNFNTEKVTTLFPKITITFDFSKIKSLIIPKN